MLTSLPPQLPLFLAVARHKSFTAAAREHGVSRSAVSQAVRQLEEALRVVLFQRTTRSVSLTDAGKRLLEGAGPAMSQTLALLEEVSAQPGELVGRLRISVPSVAVPYVITPVLPAFHERHPRICVEIVSEGRLVDIVEEGYDAGIRLTESIERDMVQVRLTEAFRFVIVGSPKYLAARGTPKRPEELLEHTCINLRATSGALYAWELERGKRTWRVPVEGDVLANDSGLRVALTEAGLGLSYVFEPMVAAQLRAGKLKRVLEPFAATVPGFFLFFPSRAQRSPALRAFVEAAKELAVSPS